MIWMGEFGRSFNGGNHHAKAWKSKLKLQTKLIQSFMRRLRWGHFRRQSRPRSGSFCTPISTRLRIRLPIHDSYASNSCSGPNCSDFSFKPGAWLNVFRGAPTPCSNVQYKALISGLDSSPNAGRPYGVLEFLSLVVTRSGYEIACPALRRPARLPTSTTGQFSPCVCAGDWHHRS